MALEKPGRQLINQVILRNVLQNHLPFQNFKVKKDKGRVRNTLYRTEIRQLIAALEGVSEGRV